MDNHYVILGVVFVVALVGFVSYAQTPATTGYTFSIPGVQSRVNVAKPLLPPARCAHENEQPVLNARCCAGLTMYHDKCRPPQPDCSKEGERRSDYGICCEGLVQDAHGVCSSDCSAQGVPAVSHNHVCCEGLREDILFGNVCRPDCARRNEYSQLHHNRCCYNLLTDESGRCSW